MAVRGGLFELDILLSFVSVFQQGDKLPKKF
jgi:hypothetical protein